MKHYPVLTCSDCKRSYGSPTSPDQTENCSQNALQHKAQGVLRAKWPQMPQFMKNSPCECFVFLAFFHPKKKWHICQYQLVACQTSPHKDHMLLGCWGRRADYPLGWSASLRPHNNKIVAMIICPWCLHVVCLCAPLCATSASSHLSSWHWPLCCQH